jgi:hypothetical protein
MTEVIKVEDCGENIGDYDIPIHNAIIIPNGATNGDMIKDMFPNAKTWEVTRDDVHCAYIEFKDICEIKSFPLSWWNAPYKGD